MRRLAALGLAAASLALATPADARPVCTEGRLEVCVNLTTCSDLCLVDPWVTVECHQGHPAIAGCDVINRIFPE